MARRPPPIPRKTLAALDAEALAFLKRQPLPAFVGLYRRLRPRPGVSETVQIVWLRGAALRGREPVIKGTLPIYAAIVGDAERLDVSARYILRLALVWNRRRRAKRANDRAGVRAAEALWRELLARPPSTLRAAVTLTVRNVERAAERRSEWARWQAEADRVRARQPDLSEGAVAELVKRRLRLAEHWKSIARRLRTDPGK